MAARAEDGSAAAPVVAAPGAAAPVVAAIVLAAGASRRFGADKRLADLDGRPILQHVLDRLADAGLDDPVVVLRPEDGPLRAAIAWRRARLVVNPDPARGLASSLRAGWGRALDEVPRPDAILVVLGDQPRLDPQVCRRVASAPLDARRPLVAPRYRVGGPNPLRLEVGAAALVEAAHGDRGLGPLLAARPDLVCWIEVDGENPDVDEPADLARLGSRFA